MNELRPADPLSLDPMDDALRAWLRPWRLALADTAPRIRVDLTEQDGSYLVKAEIPGVRKEDIDVRIDGDRLTISADTHAEKERKEGSRVVWKEREEGFASRSFTLACPVDEARAEAVYKDGVLSLTLPKKASSSTQRVAIQ